jgi:flagellar biosynthesis protein FlhA
MHLSEVVCRHGHELLSRERVASMLEKVKSTAPSLVEEVHARLKLGHVQKVLQNLLRERVPIRDLEAILEALCEAAERADDVEALGEHVRQKLARTLSQQYCDDDGKLWCVSLGPSLEEAVGAHVWPDGRHSAAAVPPELGERVSRAVAEALAALRQQGRRPVVLCSPAIRPAVRQLITASLPDAAVLGYNEIESVEVQSVESVGMEA